MFKFSDIHPEAVEKRQPEGGTINGRFKIQKADDDKRLAFGWASASASINGEIVEDCYGDIIDIMVEYGAVNACNLDGGSSTVMLLRDGEGQVQFVNNVSLLQADPRRMPTFFMVRPQTES